jgi:hypothetical protein
MVTTTMKKLLLTLALITLSFARAAHAQNAPAAQLAQNQKAALPVVTSTQATPRVQAAAQTLAQYLGRIAGAEFETKSGDGKSGIAVGLARDFSTLALEKEFDANDPARREEYLLRSHAGGVLLIGASELAVEDAVWDFLYRLGYRQFFPGQHWEIVPRTPDLKIAVNEKTKPDFIARRIWFTYGTWPENTTRMKEWSAKNRVALGLDINTTHAYGQIIADNKKEFDAHPEYFAEVDGKRDVRAQGKFDISNPGLRELVKNWALQKFERNPALDSISLDPSDGGGWGNSPQEQALGSISDRVVLLANEVAEAVNKKFPGKYIGIYAYNEHAPAPSIRVSPHVAVNVATAFITGGYSFDALLGGWQKQGATVGVRDYLSVPAWDNDLPTARASQIGYVRDNLPKFYAQGARFFSGESGDNWAPNGLSYYLASRVLWDVDEAKRADEIINDFLEKSFGPAHEPMREFYATLNGIGNTPRRPFSADFIGRLYRALDQSFALAANNDAVQARLQDLTLYVRYLELYRAYQNTTPATRPAAFEALVRFAYRTRGSHMIHSLGIYRELYRDKAMIAAMPKTAAWNVPETDRDGNPKNPWKSSVPFTAEEVQTFIKSGVENNEIVDITPRAYSRDLVPATPLHLSAPRLPRMWLRGTQIFYLWLPAGQTELRLKVTAGLTYTIRGPAKLALFAGGESADQSAARLENGGDTLIAGAPLDSAEVAPDKAEHEIVLKTKTAGLHRLQVSDSGGGTRVEWPAGLPVVVKASVEEITAYRFRESWYFYVPKGTKEVAGFAEGEVHVFDAANKEAWQQWKGEGYFKVPVAPGHDGKLWRLNSVGTRLVLLTVPSYVARAGDELLLPKEVVEADAD